MTLADDELVLAGYGFAWMFREFGVPLEGVPEVGLEELQAMCRRMGHTWAECRHSKRWRGAPCVPATLTSPARG